MSRAANSIRREGDQYRPAAHARRGQLSSARVGDKGDESEIKHDPLFRGIASPGNVPDRLSPGALDLAPHNPAEMAKVAGHKSERMWRTAWENEVKEAESRPDPLQAGRSPRSLNAS